LKEVAAQPQPALLNVVSRMSFQASRLPDQAVVEVEDETNGGTDVISNKVDECCTVSGSNGDSKRDIYRMNLQRNSLEGSETCEYI